MPDFNVQYGNPQGQQMSVADMINLARNVQAYQQAQEVNPLAVQKARMEIQQAQQLNPLAVKKAQEEVQQAQVKTQADTQAMRQNQFRILAGAQTAMMNNPLVIKAENDPESLTNLDRLKLANMLAQNVLHTAHANGVPEKDALAQVEPMLKKLQTDPSSIRQDLRDLHVQTLDAASRTGALTPSGVGVSYGSGGQVTATNPFGGVPQGQPIPGTQYTQGLAPSVQTGPTQAPFVMGGTPGGIVNPQQAVRPRPQVAPQAAPIGAPTAAPQGAVGGMTDQFQKNGGLQISPGESYEAYRTRVGNLASLPAQANAGLNPASPESVPQMMYLNNRVMNLLDKGVNVGPIADVIAGKTGNISLSAEQQEIKKYLEQRIRQEAARSNSDQASQRAAYGSFGVSADALRSILYNDNGRLTSQNLYLNGIKNNQGDPNKPDLARLNKFNNEFTRINQDPDVPHLMGVIGTKSLNQLTQSDLKHLKSEFGNKSLEDFKELFKKRDELIKLSGGK